VHDEVEAQAVVVQASHQVVMIGVGDHCDPDVAASARTASGTSGKITALARRSAYAPANCPAGDHLGVATVELAGTQRQAEPPGGVVKPV
jgi:hypothetical protein